MTNFIQGDTTGRKRKRIAVSGGIVAVAGFTLTHIPHLFAKVSLAQAHAVCTSTLGALGSLFSPTINNACTGDDIAYSLLTWAAIAGLVAALASLLHLLYSPPRTTA